MGQGTLSILLASFLLALSSVGVKLLSHHSPFLLVFGRFGIGAILTSLYFLKKKTFPVPQNLPPVLLRGIGNALAVGCFYLAISHTTVGRANLFNMTYPIHMAILSPLLLKEKTSPRKALGIVLSFLSAGFLFLFRDEGRDKNFLGDSIALAGGLISAFALLFLREARKTEDPPTILFYQMGIGTLLFSFAIPDFKNLSGEEWGIVLLTSLFGYGGQFFLTRGYRYSSAPESALLSFSQVLFAIVLDHLFFHTPITLPFLAGTAGIFSGIFLGIGKNRFTESSYRQESLQNSRKEPRFPPS